MTLPREYIPALTAEELASHKRRLDEYHSRDGANHMAAVTLARKALSR